jgi:hypothetical protein
MNTTGFAENEQAQVNTGGDRGTSLASEGVLIIVAPAIAGIWELEGG